MLACIGQAGRNGICRKANVEGALSRTEQSTLFTISINYDDMTVRE